MKETIKEEWHRFLTCPSSPQWLRIISKKKTSDIITTLTGEDK